MELKEIEKSIIERTIRGSIISFANKVRDFCFYNCTGLTKISFPNATTIGADAFANCTGLTDVNFPNVTYLGRAAFANCTGLTDVNFPNVTTFENYNTEENAVFYNCVNIRNLYLPSMVELSAIHYAIESTTYYHSQIKTNGASTIYLNNIEKLHEKSLADLGGTKLIIGNKLTTVASDLFTTQVGTLNITPPNPPSAIYLCYSNTDSVQFDATYFVITGSSKYVRTNNIYTDNSIIKDAVLSLVGEYTIVNVYHLDGSDW